MPDGDPPISRGSRVNALLIDHARRCWDAERENAERLIGRMKLMTGIAAALFGLGLFKVEWTVSAGQIAQLPWTWLSIVVRILLAAALVLLATSFWMMIRRPNRRSKAVNASWHLFLSEIELESLPDDEELAGALVASKIQRAAMSLARRNARLHERLDTSINVFLASVGCAFLALFIYIVTSVPPIIVRAGDAHGVHRDGSRRLPAATAPPDVHDVNGPSVGPAG